VTTKTTIVPVIGIKVTAAETVATSVNTAIASNANVWTHQRKHLVARRLPSVVPRTLSETNDVMTRTITADAAGTVAIVVELVVTQGSLITVRPANV